MKKSSEYGGWERTNQAKSNIYSRVILAECGLELLSKSTFFLLLTSVGYFLGFWCVSSGSWKNKSMLRVWLGFKNSKGIILRWSRRTHSITFSSIKLRLWGRLRIFILVNPQALAQNLFIKDPFFFSYNDIIGKWVISMPWKKTFVYVLYFDLRPGPKILFQGDTPEGSDTFQWPVIERDRVGGLRRMIWDKVKVPLCHYSQAPEESNLWTAW